LTTTRKYNHAVALDDAGEIVWDGQLGGDEAAWRDLKAALLTGEPIQSVLEAGWNWGILFDRLEALDFHPKLANPLKTRWIAESFVKTDQIDATVHARLLRAGLTPLVHVPCPTVREQRNLLRRRFWLVKTKTSLKNRIHSLLARHHLEVPESTDLFGIQGRTWLKQLSLPGSEGQILEGDLSLMDILQRHIRETEHWIDDVLKDHPLVGILQTLPGVGKIFAALIALEIDTMDRFVSVGKFCSYSGLVNSTYSSGGKTFHGGLVPTCNRRLRYAFIEAAWTASRISPYFRAFYTRLKARKGSHAAIGATARKLCEIAYVCLTHKRPYEERVYRFRSRGALRIC
jgi:transposase